MLTAASVSKRFRERAAEIETAVVCESARWGDSTMGGKAFNIGGPPAKRTACTQEDWRKEIDRIVTDYFPRRSEVVLGQLYRHGVVLDLDPPQFNQFGGDVDRGFRLQLDSPQGKVYFTTNGEDPRLIGGEVAPSATEFAQPLQFEESTVIKARTLLDGEWSALAEPSFRIPE